MGAGVELAGEGVEKREPDADGTLRLRLHELTHFTQPPSRFIVNRSSAIGEDASLSRRYIDINGVEAESDLKQSDHAHVRVSDEGTMWPANSSIDHIVDFKVRSSTGAVAPPDPVDDEVKVRGSTGVARIELPVVSALDYLELNAFLRDSGRRASTTRKHASAHGGRDDCRSSDNRNGGEVAGGLL